MFHRAFPRYHTFVRLIIFTDVDGTLIDHFTYRWEEAVPTLALLKAINVPVILNTSKTYAETLKLVREMGLKYPFAVENGAAIFFPMDFSPLPEGCARVGEGYCALVLGRTYDEIRGFFREHAERYHLKGMGDMDLGTLRELTGLPEDVLELTRRRMFSEPFVAGDPERLEEFVRVAGENGYKVLRGGRFYHLVSADQSKGKVVEVVRSLFGEGTLTVGLGDSENDEDMLRAVDIPVLIPNPKRGYAPLSVPNLIRAKCLGPKGWSEEVMRILKTLKLV